MTFWSFLGPWHIQKTNFSSMNPYFNGKLCLFLTEVSFDTSKGNQLSYFQNGYFFKIIILILWASHIIREYAGKKIKWFLNVSPLTIVNILLWPFMVFSLYIHAFSKQQTKETTSWQTFAKRPASFVCLETFFYSNEEPFEGWTKICAFRLTPSEKENHLKIDCSLKEVCEQ